MRTLLVSGNPLAEQYATVLQDLGFDVVNGSPSILARIGVSDDNSYRELTEAEIQEAIRDAEVFVYGGLEPATRNVIEAGESLKMIAFLGTGWSDPGCVDADAATQNSIIVSNTPHANAYSTAEMTIGMIIDLERQITRMNSDVRRGASTPIRRSDVRGRRLGIVGLGHVGYEVASIMRRAFDVSIAYTGPNRKPGAEDELSAKYMPLDELLRWADYISVHTPGAETSGLIGAEQLAQIRPTSLLINTATPSVVEGLALIAAVESGQIRGVAMDGMYSDPALASRFLSLPEDKIIATPRAAWLTDNSYNRMSEMMVSSVTDYAQNSPIAHRVA